jgi:hypothetical protein
MLHNPGIYHFKAAAVAGNRGTLRTLRQRQAALPVLTLDAEIAIAEADVAHEAVQLATIEPLEAQAKAAYDAALEAYEAAQAALLDAENRYRGLWHKSIGCNQRRHEAELKLHHLRMAAAQLDMDAPLQPELQPA